MSNTERAVPEGTALIQKAREAGCLFAQGATYEEELRQAREFMRRKGVLRDEYGNLKVVDEAKGSVRFTVPSHYGIGPEFDTFAGAVEYARADQREYQESPRALANFVPRAFVELRQEAKTPLEPIASGVDERILLWEVYPDRVVLVPRGQGGLSTEQKELTELEAESARARTEEWHRAACAEADDDRGVAR